LIWEFHPSSLCPLGGREWRRPTPCWWRWGWWSSATGRCWRSWTTGRRWWRCRAATGSALPSAPRTLQLTVQPCRLHLTAEGHSDLLARNLGTAFGDDDQDDEEPGRRAGSTSDATVRDTAKHVGVPLRRVDAVAGAGRLFSTPSRPAWQRLGGHRELASPPNRGRRASAGVPHGRAGAAVAWSHIAVRHRRRGRSVPSWPEQPPAATPSSSCCGHSRSDARPPERSTATCGRERDSGLRGPGRHYAAAVGPASLARVSADGRSCG
jgi:hypothetical protein